MRFEGLFKAPFGGKIAKRGEKLGKCHYMRHRCLSQEVTWQCRCVRGPGACVVVDVRFVQLGRRDDSCMVADLK